MKEWKEREILLIYSSNYLSKIMIVVWFIVGLDWNFDSWFMVWVSSCCDDCYVVWMICLLDVPCKVGVIPFAYERWWKSDSLHLWKAMEEKMFECRTFHLTWWWKGNDVSSVGFQLVVEYNARCVMHWNFYLEVLKE